MRRTWQGIFQFGCLDIHATLCAMSCAMFSINVAMADEIQEISPYSRAPEASASAGKQVPSLRSAKRPLTSPPIVVTGEVVDAWCYASGTMGPGRGPTHRACALACIAGGVTPGIAEDGTGLLWVAAKYKGYQGCKEILLPLVARHVKVQGWAAHIGSCNLLKIKSIQVLDGPDAGKTITEPTKGVVNRTPNATKANPVTNRRP